MLVSIVKHEFCKILSFLAQAYLLVACTTVPIIRDYPVGSIGGGFWEQDENTEPRFYRGSESGKSEIGTLYVSGSNAYVNGSRVNETTEIGNNTFVNTGLQSAVRIVFNKDDSTCLIHVQDFRVGNGYGDTTSCQHNIGTTHADSQIQKSLYHFNVSQQQTEVTVLRGLVKVALHSDPSQTINVNSGEEAVVTANSIIGPRPVSPDEIKKRVRWRNNYKFYSREVDWATVGAVAAGIAVIGGAAAVGLGGNNRPPSPPPSSSSAPSPAPTGPCDPKLTTCDGVPIDSTVDYGQAVPAPTCGTPTTPLCPIR